jgi:asparagine synthase (glutamine-hydrolysing)
MSVQFGRWNFDGAQVPREYVGKVSSMLAPYGPDSDGFYSQDGTTILYRAFHTTGESRREKQPTISQSGAVITWDGRLDNRAELIGELRASLAADSTDADIVLAAYEKWGTNCFAKLIGDWALAVWNPRLRSLILAKDPIGPRHLYYSFNDRQITWCTVLDPLVLFAGKTFKLCEEYIAGWLSLYPATHLTPYVGIHAVSPSSCVFLGPRKHIVAKHWDFDPSKKIRYRTDGEYEEHFRSVFFQAVRRRLRSDAPVLAELSGGRDSSSIVCVADEIMARGEGETPRLDTISYYDDSEANWNERSYFTKVEEKRGRTGCHVQIGTQDLGEKVEPKSHVEVPEHRFIPNAGDHDRTYSRIRMCMASQGNRVLLSGIGGDEVMGGVPTPLPQIQDLLARAHLRALAHHLKIWALEKRKPWLYVLFEAARGFFPPEVVGVPKHARPAPWLQANFVKHHWSALTGYPSRLKLFAATPSFQDSVSTLEGVQRQLACFTVPFEPPYEKRYSFLDRELLEFIFAIPREQLVRPTQRRSLMRRALVGVVPDEILNRKRKAFVVRAPLIKISKTWAHFVETNWLMVSSSIGIVDVQQVSDALQKTLRGDGDHMIRLMRTIYIETWLRNLCTSGVVNLDTRLNAGFALPAFNSGMARIAPRNLER